MAKKKKAEKKAEKKGKRKMNPKFQAIINRKFKPSDALAKVIGSDPITRPQATKKLWDYFKKNNLQIPERKQYIKADDNLRPVFGKEEIKMTEVGSILKNHLTPV